MSKPMGKPRPRPGRSERGPTPSAPPPLPGEHRPSLLLATLIAAALALLSVSFVLFETDFWQHLLVGRVIWETHTVPTRQIWIWPTYGAPDVTPSWGFRALIWPFWSLGGVWGLFVWRWLTTLAAFGIGWATARRMGARGAGGLIVVVLAALVYRQRSQIRPETLVAVLLALQFWILERRRHGGRDLRPWLVPLAWVWANVHISYFLAPLILALYVIGAEEPPAPSRRGWVIALAMGAVAFLNPHGWRALWQPFEFALTWRHEPIFETIGELRPVDWSVNSTNGLPLLVFGWPALIVWRWRRGKPDMIEAMICALFTALAIGTRRFLGFYAVACVPFAARDLAAWLATLPAPGVARSPWVRAGLASLVAIGIALPELTRANLPLAVRIDYSRYPVAACRFMAAHGVRGHGFNPFYFGGYLLWRFWPDPGRLPFMDIHQSGTDEDRRAYGRMIVHPEEWTVLDRRHHFDYLLLNRVPSRSDRLLDRTDRDPLWALVFMDDAAALFVRREGPLAAVADSFAYRLIPAGRAGWDSVSARCHTDLAYRGEVRAELERCAAASPFASFAHSQLANLSLLDGNPAEARRELELALALDPFRPTVHERLGRIALAEGRPRVARDEFAAERRLGPPRAGLDLEMGRAYQALGDPGRARALYARELRRDPGNREARAALDSLAGRTRP
jgi:hypothetical protein